jgi:hypothetical protein
MQEFLGRDKERAARQSAKLAMKRLAKLFGYLRSTPLSVHQQKLIWQNEPKSAYLDPESIGCSGDPGPEPALPIGNPFGA